MSTRPMAHVLVLEEEPFLRNLVRPHLSALGESVHVVESIEEAQRRASARDSALLVVRGRGEARYAAELACAFEPRSGATLVRLILLETGATTPPEGKGAAAYLHELDRTIACSQFPQPFAARGAAGCEGLAPDFPHDAYQAVARVGALDGGVVFLVRSRITGRKDLLVQTSDDEIASGAVVQALYRNFRACARPFVDILRHEVGRNHSFVASGCLPFDLARQAQLGKAA